MKSKKQRLVLSLIKDDLINSKLVNGLNDLGINSGMYYLHLSDTIFDLLGYDKGLKNEPIFEYYLELTKRSKYIDISQSHKPLEKLAREIYTELMLRKPLHQGGLCSTTDKK